MKTSIFLVAMLAFFATQVSFAHNPEQTIRSFYAAVDAGDFDKAGTFLSDEVKVTLPFSPEVMNKEAYKQIGMSMYAGFPGFQHKVLELTASKKSAAFKAWFSGTNTGSLMGNPPTGNRVEMPFQGYATFDGKGKIATMDIAFDQSAFNAQLMKGLPDPKAMAEKNVRELFKLMDAGQTDQFGPYCAVGFKISNPFLPAPSPIEAFQGVIQGQKAAFPDMRHEVVQMVSDGKNVVTHGIFSGTNTGSMMGNPPTGNKVSLPFLVLDQVDAAGKITSRNVQFDSKSFEAQLMAGINPGAAAEANIRTMLAAADAGDAEKFMSYWAADAVNYFAGKKTSQEDLKNRVPIFKTAFPDIKRSLDEVVVSGNTVTVRGWVTGTNKGKFMGNKPTGNSIKVSWLGFYKLNAAGKVEAGWVEFDMETLKNQVAGNSVGAVTPAKH